MNPLRRVPPPTARGLAGVALLVWIVCRGFLAVVRSVDQDAGGLRPTLTLPQIVFLAGVATAVVLLEARRRGDLLFLRNLGFSPLHVACGAVGPLVLGEFLLRAWLGR